MRSSGMLGYGLEALVDMAASCLVLWRFWDAEETEAGARANDDREQRANVLIAFIVSCGCSLEGSLIVSPQSSAASSLLSSSCECFRDLRRAPVSSGSRLLLILSPCISSALPLRVHMRALERIWGAFGHGVAQEWGWRRKHPSVIGRLRNAFSQAVCPALSQIADN